MLINKTNLDKLVLELTAREKTLKSEVAEKQTIIDQLNTENSKLRSELRVLETTVKGNEGVNKVEVETQKRVALE